MANESSIQQLALIQSLIDEQAWEQAASQLSAQIMPLLADQQGEAITQLLQQFPAEWTGEHPELLFVAGLVHAQSGQIEQGLKLLERARFASLIPMPNYHTATRISLEIVRLHFQLDHVQAALHHLHDVIQPLIDQGQVTDLRLQGQFFHFMSEISPDEGRQRESIDYARRAFAAFQAVQDSDGQFRALLRLASAHIHLGEYVEAEGRLAAAQGCYEGRELTASARVYLLNPLIHLAWYRGNLHEAHQHAEEYLALADQEQFSNFRVYARILLGNLERATGNYSAAEKWYQLAQAVAERIHYQRHLPWIHVQLGWVRLLTGQLNAARLLFHAALREADLGEAMSFQVGLAVIYLLEGQGKAAERLLVRSASFYQNSGDLLPLTTIRFYLALAAWQSHQPEQAAEHLALALAWMAQHRIDYLPHWLHPSLITEALIQAIQLELYPEVVERILVYHLGTAALPALRQLRYAEQPSVKKQAERLLLLITQQHNDQLGNLPEGPSKRTIAALLRSGHLSPEGFDRLQTELRPAQVRPKANSTLLAVFALYTNGYSRQEIAIRLGCSLANVRNYITLIYQHFGINAQDFSTRAERRQALIALARERGFLP